MSLDQVILSLAESNLTEEDKVYLAGCSLDTHPTKHNWVEDAGGLPEYICEIARALVRSGRPTSEAISIAVSRCKVRAAGGSNVDADTRAKAAAAIAEWEKKKASSHVKASAYEPDVFKRLELRLSGKHDLIFYENRNTPEVVPQGSEGKKKGGKAGKVVKRRAATAEEEKKIASGDWLRVDKGGNKPGDGKYKGGSNIRPQLRASADDTDAIALSKTFAASDFHKAHADQKCSRWQHGSNPPAATMCRAVGGKHLGACAEHYKEMKK